MISEQEIYFNQQPEEIFKNIYKNGSYKENDILISYFGNKNYIPLNEDDKFGQKKEEEDNEENNYLFIEYKNIYIGGLSINNIFNREKFGLNIYSNESFYIGRWESNMKEGIGFLKINENLMYIGNFNSNQFNGFGILYDKIRNNFFLGQFNNGEYVEGIFYNIENEYFYRGGIKNGKKNGKLCTFFDVKKGYIFFGEIIEDEYNKGYIYFTELTEDNQDEEIKFNIPKILYFDGLGADNKVFLNETNFTEKFYSKIQDLGNSIFQADFNLKDHDKNLIKYFNVLNGIKDIDKYYKAENYNSFKNEQNMENEFIMHYYMIFQEFKEGQESLNLKDYEKVIDQPETVV